MPSILVRALLALGTLGLASALAAAEGALDADGVAMLFPAKPGATAKPDASSGSEAAPAAAPAASASPGHLPDR